MTRLDTRAIERSWERAYAETDDWLWQAEPIPILERAMEVFRSHGVRTVADLGCGDGRNLAVLAEEFSCLGIDVAPTALARAHERTGGSGSFYVCADLQRTGVADRSTDAVTCLDVFGQLPDPAAALGEMARILVPGGLLALNAYSLADSEYGRGDPVGPHTFLQQGTLFRYFDRDALAGLLEGWTTLSIERQSWEDPPHGAFRPYRHVHDSWVVLARSPT